MIMSCLVVPKSHQISQYQTLGKKASVCYPLLLQKEESLILKTPNVIFSFELNSELCDSVTFATVVHYHHHIISSSLAHVSGGAPC